MKTGSLVALMVAALLACAPASAADISGWAVRAVTYRGAVAPLIAAAERGNPAAQAKLGFLYATGRNVPQNNTLACYWYRRGAEQGNAAAQAKLGFLYATGRNVPQNYTLAAYWYRRGAEQGNAAAQHLLGLTYDKGFGVPPDYVLAYMWLNLAAARTRGDVHEDNIRLRDAVAGKISLGQLADAQQLAAVWYPKPERF